MTRKDLMRLRQLTEEVKDSAAAVEELRSAAERTTALLDGLPRACNTSMRETMTIRLVEAEERHRALVDELFWRRTDALTAIIEDVRDARCRRLLVARFVDCESWDVISSKMYYSTRQLLRLCQAGMKELEAADAERGK